MSNGSHDLVERLSGNPMTGTGRTSPSQTLEGESHVSIANLASRRSHKVITVVAFRGICTCGQALIGVRPDTTVHVTFWYLRVQTSTYMAIPQRIAVTEVNHWHSSYDANYLECLRSLGVDIVGVSDHNIDLAEDRAAKYSSKAFTDYRAMVEETNPDFVIALGRHIDMPDIARFLIDADIPFMMEKPMGLSAEIVSSLADLTEARGAWVAVPFPNRMLPWAQRAKAMIEAGDFGRISHVVFRIIRPTMERYREWGSPWMWERKAAGGGALLNLGGHGMDLTRHLIGPEISVASGVISNRIHHAEVEDYAMATLRNTDGVLAHIEVGYTWPTWPENKSDLEMKIAGEKAVLRALPQGVQLIAQGREEMFPGGATAAGLYPTLVEDTLRRAGCGEPPAITVRDCANAVELLDQAYRLAGRT